MEPWNISVILVVSFSLSKISLTKPLFPRKHQLRTVTIICFTIFLLFQDIISASMSTLLLLKLKYCRTTSSDGRPRQAHACKSIQFLKKCQSLPITTRIIPMPSPSISSFPQWLPTTGSLPQPYWTISVYGVPFGVCCLQYSLSSFFLTTEGNFIRKIHNGVNSKRWETALMRISKCKKNME